jgi:holo-[acyl-carrier protein] synthase
VRRVRGEGRVPRRGGAQVIVGLGVDIVDVARIRALAERHGDRFLERIFTAGERRYSMSRTRRHEHLAARFAAKEAALKALGTGARLGLRMTDVEVVNGPMGEPGLKLSGEAARRASRLGVTVAHVTLTHADAYAAAVVVLEK